MAAQPGRVVFERTAKLGQGRVFCGIILKRRHLQQGLDKIPVFAKGNQFSG